MTKEHSGTSSVSAWAPPLTALPDDIHYINVYHPEGDTMRVSKWGNSLAVRLPASVIEALALQDGDDIELHVQTARSFDVTRAPRDEEIIERLKTFRTRLPADFRFDREDANERK
jgi:antitoxin MazE